MKKIICLLLLAIPCLCFAQNKKTYPILKVKTSFDIENIEFKIVSLNTHIEDRLGKRINREFYIKNRHKMPYNNKQDDGVTVLEYDIKVTDMEYESFLAGQQNISFFEEENLKSKNRNYVATWNKRHYSTDDFSDNMYVEPIDYDPTYEYGKEFEYKLYMFFKFMEKKHKIKFS